MKLITSATLSTLLLSASALADNQFYAGLKAGVSHLDGVDRAVTNWTGIDDTDTAYGIYAGYRLLPALAVEAGYNYLGEFDLKDVNGSYEASSFDLLLKVSGNVTDAFSLYAKGGISIYDWQANGSGVESDDSDVSPTLAFGAQYALTQQFDLGLEYQVYADIGGTNIGVGNLLLSYSW
ncbi:outer membrane beta-barrel protein [Vibrio sp. V39_P1S14PM300]|uniref:outer membrane beta-barrel protein n=1 Tax=Vibrio sp. V39_P1S14PM300 TaxID=1938690 RepID=UPI0013735CD2|nr:outer membrane beta-barrel protein [Vibrio sp. V39_P1S14PM300]NAX21360.1 outer membrane beta-barrel protein [Vibrio sp. V39_P1S14PM300]